MNRTLRRTLTAVAATTLAASAGAAAAPAASAHPLGNFTVNYHTGLTMRPDRVDALIVVDRAEISALQERALIDTDHDGSINDDESRAYSETACAALGRQLHVSVAGVDLRWRADSSTLVHQPGEAGLKTSRLTCRLTAPAALTQHAGITVRTAYDTRRIGWREITAAAGQGLTLTRSDVPASSATHELRQYPEDPLASPLDQHTAKLRTAPGGSTAPASAVNDIPGAGPVAGLLTKVTTVFDSLVGAREITLPIGLLALLLALVLGASHAAMPGHGKTIMAAYLAGRRGTRRDAVTVGATVTLTHTAGVLVLGLALPAATHLAGEAVLTWLGAASGFLITCVGLWLLTGALRGRARHNHHHHGDGHTHTHDHHPHHHDHTHDHGHRHHSDGPAHDHVDGPPPGPSALIPARRGSTTRRPEETGRVATLAPAHHSHTHTHTATAPKQVRRRGKAGLIGMGIAGGLVPSPSALVVLLGAVALGRTAFGILLVVGYGLGMAATLTLAGLLLVRVRERIENHHRGRIPRDGSLVRAILRAGPVLTSLLVIAVGFGLTLRAVTGN
ncbi:nickel transporter [Streptomyces goshikiensis]|uniref:HoxN/HupN/NixA family nickel/cobalt transporter n=1 Tax=Streptomyces goshikiensis TaxID=1942 RepID=UPI0037F61F35